MSPHRYFLLGTILLLAGCAALPARAPSVSPAAEAKTPPAAPGPVLVPPAPAAGEPSSPAPPSQALTPQILYQMLLAEIALQRGEKVLSARAYTDLAQATRDWRIASRATQVALAAGQPDLALVAARLWLSLDPKATAARQTVAGILVARGRLLDAKPHLEALLAEEGPRTAHAFLHLDNLLARHPDRRAVLELVSALAEPYPSLPEAHFAVARAALKAEDWDLASAAIARALALRPDWEAAVVLESEILKVRDLDAAAARLAAFLARHPQAREVRLAYARLLVQKNDFAVARQEFEKLVRDFPQSPEVPFAIGLLSMQLGEWATAAEYLERALDLGFRDRNAVLLYLGQVEEARRRWQAAQRWYEAVEGERAFAARLKVAQLIARQGRVAEARAYLAGLKPATTAQRVLVIQAEAQVLREARRFQEAFRLLSQALEKFPDTPDLLYDRAMVAERLDKLSVLEADLRKLIRLKPDHAHAYNALGYTLADRTTRYEEARVLLEKALALAPDDPFVLDSMGWLYYKLKDYAKAQSYLERAFGLRADAEIAAHLGEVLWARSAREAALRIWRRGREIDAENESLRETLARHGIVLP